MIKGAIFDMDGVLLDSMQVWDSLGILYLRKQGKEPKKDLQKILFTKSMMDSSRYIKEEYHIPKTPEQIQEEIIDCIRECYEKTISAKPGVCDFLSCLKRDGVKIAIATASDKELAVSGMKHNGLLSYIDVIVTCKEVGVGKEAPDVFEQALKLLDVSKEQTVIFEDSLHAIQTAKRAGFRTIGIYDAANEQHIKEIRETADYYMTTMEHIDAFYQYIQSVVKSELDRGD